MIKSWHLTFTGGLINIILGVLIIVSFLISSPRGGLGAAISVVMLLMFGAILLILGSISLPIALLLKKKGLGRQKQ